MLECWGEKYEKVIILIVELSLIETVKRDLISFEGRMEERFVDMEER